MMKFVFNLDSTLEYLDVNAFSMDWLSRRRLDDIGDRPDLAVPCHEYLVLSSLWLREDDMGWCCIERAYLRCVSRGMYWAHSCNMFSQTYDTAINDFFYSLSYAYYNLPIYYGHITIVVLFVIFNQHF